LLIALWIGLGVAVVVGLVVTGVSASRCTADEECLAVLSGIGYGVLAGGIATAIALVVLSIRLKAGVIFGVGAAVAVLLLLRAAWGIQLGQSPLFLFLAAVVFVGASVLNSCYGSADGWRRPTLAAVVIAVGVLVVAAFPAGSKLVSVRSEQQRIEAVIARPLQTELDGTRPYSVRYAGTGIDYTVFEPPAPDGSRTGYVDVTVRNLAPDQAPCTGFTDRTEGAVTQCTELESDLWRARGAHGESRYFVAAGDRQWAYVRSGTYDGGPIQRMHDARAEQIARSLEPRSAWPLAADSADCGFCEWLT
jgi:hypothetical protein